MRSCCRLPNIKLLLLLIVLLVSTRELRAQSHNPGVNYNCKLKKNNWLNEEKHPCPACENTEKKEKLAKAAENKKRQDAGVARAEAEKKAREQASAIQRAEAKKTENGTQLLINASVDNSKPTKKDLTGLKTTLISKKDHSKSKLFSKTGSTRAGYWMVLLDEAGDTVLTSTELYGMSWDDDTRSTIYLDEKRASDIPLNVAMVRVNGREFNLINAKGEMLLSEPNIWGLKYCGNNFFMYFTGPVGESSYSITGDGMVLYDFQLKKKYTYSPFPNAANCKFSKRCMIGRTAKLGTSAYLFTFTQEKCTHTFEGQLRAADVDNYGVGQDRVPVHIGITHTQFYPHD